MAKPQKEDGYTAIANEILEAMARIKLSPTQYRLLFVVWRYTYGFQRKEADLSLSFLANSTGCDKRQLQRELKELVDRNIIFQRLEKRLTRIIGFNKDYESWLPIGEIDNGSLTNGEIDNGEIDNGEIDNGEISESAIGQTVNTPIGEIDNQEIKHLKKTLKKDIYIVFNHWNEQKIITHKNLNDKTKGHISARLKDGFTPEEICEAISNYKSILDSDLYYWTHKWTLAEFLVRGLDKFKTESDPFTNYLKNKDSPQAGGNKGDPLAYLDNVDLGGEP